MRRIAALVLFFAVLGHVGPSAAADAVVYIGPSGDDKATGQSQSASLATLQTAIKRVLAQSGPDITNRRVVVLPGRYVEQVTTIDKLPGNSPLSISASPGPRPVFDGNGRGRTWLLLQHATGKPSQLTIQGLEISNYVTAISLNGDRSSPDASNSKNVVQDNVFRNIGQIAFPSGKPSTAVIRLVNSKQNQIVRNQFINVRNVTGCSALHAIYLAHNSSENLIEGNTFENGCGAVVKTRDASNSNIVRGNRFIAQEDTLFLDSYCNKDARDDCTKETSECPSWGNQVQNNSAERMGPRARKAPTTALGPDTVTGCTPPSGRGARFSSSNNRF